MGDQQDKWLTPRQKREKEFLDNLLEKLEDRLDMDSDFQESAGHAVDEEDEYSRQAEDSMERAKERTMNEDKVAPEIFDEGDYGMVFRSQRNEFLRITRKLSVRRDRIVGIRVLKREKVVGSDDGVWRFEIDTIDGSYSCELKLEKYSSKFAEFFVRLLTDVVQYGFDDVVGLDRDEVILNYAECEYPEEVKDERG